MIKLTLQATTREQELIKHFLEENVSEELAKKINNGVRTTVDGKELINRKTIDGFMKYATDEARKTAEKNANCACIEDKVVFGWAKITSSIKTGSVIIYHYLVEINFFTKNQ